MAELCSGNTVMAEDMLRRYVEIIHGITGIYAGTLEEFRCYYLNSAGRFSLIKESATSQRVIGIRFSALYGNRNLVTIILFDRMTPVRSDMADGLGIPRNQLCLNTPNIMWAEQRAARRISEVTEYSIRPSDLILTIPGGVLPEIHISPFDTGELVAWDDEVFGFGRRADYIRMCAARSAIVYVTRSNDNRITGFGMLSKVTNGKRLLGPVYAESSVAAIQLLQELLYLITFDHPEITTVAYLPEECLGCSMLPRMGFRRSIPLKQWKRISDNSIYHGKEGKIVALGSMLFDVC